MQIRIIPICLLAMISGWAMKPVPSRHPISPLTLNSPDTRLVQAFQWAKRQALAYAMDGDAVGPWYEAALPGRQAFCMRDVSHQAMGAAALGLGGYTRNMLLHFAAGVSNSRDWCSYWEINRWGRPAPVDYQSDARFWYDLPANFDVLDACYRMFVWSGDRSYLRNPAFQRFYRRTVSNYVRRWDLDPSTVMQRPRLLNVRGMLNPHDHFQTARGIPGYNEGSHGFVLGVDLLDAEYDAFRDFARMQADLGHSGQMRTYLQQAERVRQLVNGSWWDASGQHFRAYLDNQYHLGGVAAGDLLYRDVPDAGRRRQRAIADYVAFVRSHPSTEAVEEESHRAEILYRYGHPRLAYQQILDLARPGRDRQAYPEVSFSVIGAITSGLMGISVDPASPERAGYRNPDDVIVATLPGLTRATGWVKLSHLPVHGNVISVRHTGAVKSELWNERGPALVWRAEFQGSHRHFTVNGRAVAAHAGTLPDGAAESWVTLVVGAGDHASVAVVTSASGGA